MIKAAYKYREELTNLISTQYKTGRLVDYFSEFSDVEINSMIKCGDFLTRSHGEYGEYHFVSLNKDKKIIGYIQIICENQMIENIAIVNFEEKPSINFSKDLLKIIKIFIKYKRVVSITASSPNGERSNHLIYNKFFKHIGADILIKPLSLYYKGKLRTEYIYTIAFPENVEYSINKLNRLKKG